MYCMKKRGHFLSGPKRFNLSLGFSMAEGLGGGMKGLHIPDVDPVSCLEFFTNAHLSLY